MRKNSVRRIFWGVAAVALAVVIIAPLLMFALLYVPLIFRILGFGSEARTTERFMRSRLETCTRR